METDNKPSCFGAYRNCENRCPFPVWEQRCKKETSKRIARAAEIDCGMYRRALDSRGGNRR